MWGFRLDKFGGVAFWIEKRDVEIACLSVIVEGSDLDSRAQVQRFEVQSTRFESRFRETRRETRTSSRDEFKRCITLEDKLKNMTVDYRYI